MGIQGGSNLWLEARGYGHENGGSAFILFQRGIVRTLLVTKNSGKERSDTPWTE